MSLVRAVGRDRDAEVGFNHANSSVSNPGKCDAGVLGQEARLINL